jgi:ATP-binding cassette, subfamily B, bacterial
MLLSTSDLYEQALFLDDLFVFFSMRPTIAAPADPVPVPRPIREGFEFRDVWFRYPDPESAEDEAVPAKSVPRERGRPPDDASWVLRGVSFRIRTRRALGAGGRERCGKTTLIKLLRGSTSPRWARSCWTAGR